MTFPTFLSLSLITFAEETINLQPAAEPRLRRTDLS